MNDLNPSQEIQAYLDKIVQEQSDIDDRFHEIDQNVNFLEHEKVNLLDRYGNLDSAKEICYRALAGEPVAIWRNFSDLDFRIVKNIFGAT